MSIRVDTASLIAGALVCGNRGLGVLGSTIPSTGDDGPSVLYNDVDPGDEASEFRALILSTPPGGSIFFYEDGSFEAADFADGLHSGTYEGFKDGVSYGVASYSFQIGATAVEVAPGVGSITITGYAPTVAQSNARSIEPGVGAITITGHAPTISQPIGVSPSAGSLTITGYAPTVTQASVSAIAPGVGQIVLTGYAPTVEQTAHRYVRPGAGALTITGYAPTVTRTGSTVRSAPPSGRRLSTTRRLANLSTRTR